MVLGAASTQGALMGRVKHTAARVVAVAAALLCLALPAFAQGTLTDAIASRQQGPGGAPQRLLVEAKEIVYNDDKNTVEASGDVELNYGGRTLQADRVVYDRATGRVTAIGNARLTDASGTVTTGSRFELTDDFRTGFIDTLRVEQTTKDRSGPVRTRFAAPRAERIEGDTTIFENGTYTPCEPCREHPERPPLWQVKAARIIHNNSERTIYYEDASFEFLGVPVAYIPYFWSPDPSVRRQTGFLAPHYINSSALGTGVALPFFWAIAPDYDLTLQPTIYSRQGVLAQAEFRQRLLTGSYNIRAAGIFQQDKSAFLPSPFGPGDRDGRGSIETTGRFNINEHWRYGWDVALLSDKWFLQNFKIKSESLVSNYVSLESTSTIFLQGQGDRSFFDLRGYYFQGLSYADWQKQLPLVAPVLDYNKRINGPGPLGGELAFDVNTYNLTRESAQFQANYLPNRSYPFGTNATGLGYPYESCAVFQKNVCLLRALPGDFARTSVKVSWRRAFVDDAGQVWTPFAYFKADGFYSNPNTSGFQNAQIGNFYDTRQDFVGRAMPAVGLEYRYPFIADAGAYGTHTLTPIGQVIARPNEGRIGRVQNEDAHSLVFDDTTLFDWDKFSGYDRAEGGVRANVGLQYNVTTPSGWTGNALFGQSYQLAGRNSFAAGDLLNTGLDSGLDTRASDYVGRVQVNPSDNYSLIVRGRFNNNDFSVDSFEAQASANLKPWIPFTGTLTYARYAAQPLLGISHRREGLAPGASFALTPNWTVNGSVLFELDRYLDARDTYTAAYLNALAYGQAAADAVVYNRTGRNSIASTGLGIAYRDECTTFSVNYSMSPRLGATGTRENDQTVLVRLELRTLGQTAISQNVSGTTSADGIATR
jgi:LPS-assembly protein